MDTTPRFAPALLAVAFAVPLVAAGPTAEEPCTLPTEVSTVPAPGSCGWSVVGSLDLAGEDAGLGQVAVHGDLAAVVRRDEGVVTLVDVADPTAPRALGSYDGGTGVGTLDHPLDGDVAFSSDGTVLFHARQTSDYSNEGLHVLDVTDPTAPRLTDLELQGGMLRVAYVDLDGTELVATQDAIGGLTLFEVVRTPLGAQTVPVFADALPGLHVGGPASAGLEFVAADPVLGVPLLHAADGTTGLRVYDVSTPTAPELLWATGDAPLAAIAVEHRDGVRLVHAASEYWFDGRRLPELLTYELADDGTTTEVARRTLGPYDGSLPWKLGGLEQGPDGLLVAHGHAGALLVDPATDEVHRATTDLGAPSFRRSIDLGLAGWYAMDVARAGERVLVTDAVTGELRVLAPVG